MPRTTKKKPMTNIAVENLVKKKAVLKESDESDEDVYETVDLTDESKKKMESEKSNEPIDNPLDAYDKLLEKKLSAFQEQLIAKLASDREKRAALKLNQKEKELREKELAKIQKETAKKSDLEYLTKIITHNKEELIDRVKRDEHGKYIDRINNLRKSSLMF